MSDFDRQQESLERERQAASPGHETSGAGQPTGKIIQINPKLAGCGCFGCSSLVFLAGCVALLVIVWGFLLPDWRANNRYVPSSGLVLDKRLDSQMFDVAGPKGHGGRKQESYRPEIKIRYEVNGQKFESWAYDAGRIYSPNRDAQQAIIDSFQVGATYACWYDPDRPDQVILVRGHTWGAYVSLIFPLGLLTVGGLGFLFAWKISSMQPVPVASAGPSSNAPPVPRWVPWLQRLASPRYVFDPAHLGDPIAMKTEWAPLKDGGANFRIHKLVEVDLDRLEFRATRQGILFALVFLLVGMVALVAVLMSIVSGFSSGKMNLNLLAALPVTLLFSSVGGYLLYSFRTPIVFDKRKGLFWKGRKEPEEVFDGSSLKNATNLKEIHALQLVSSHHSRYSSYELNLVLINGERLNVVVYGTGNRGQLRKDTSILAEFLGVPLWDAT